MVPRRMVQATQGWLRTPYVLADPPCVHRQGPDVRLPKIVTFRRAVRAVIGPLTKTPRRTIKVHDCVESVCVVAAPCVADSAVGV